MNEKKKKKKFISLKKKEKINVVKDAKYRDGISFTMVDSIHEILMSCLAHPSIDSIFFVY